MNPGTDNIIEYGNPDADIILIQPSGDHEQETLENEAGLIRELSGTDFRFIGYMVKEWNRDLSPWKAPAVFGNEDFGDGAADTLSGILKLCTHKDKKYFLGGYSLAGLFSLWAACQTDSFAGIAAASPSVWFPGFNDYVQKNDIRTEGVYLSLGDREEMTKNAVMRTVGDRIRECHSLLSTRNIPCILEWNRGGHFKEPDIRTARAFAQLLHLVSVT
ncbi:MAG: esterase [Lachnospiraceae bacterium]|nr:esterase [Lachnospiraceae bacterium]